MKALTSHLVTHANIEIGGAGGGLAHWRVGLFLLRILYVYVYVHVYVYVYVYLYNNSRSSLQRLWMRLGAGSSRSPATSSLLHRYGISSIKPSKIPPPARKSCSEHASKLLCLQKGCSGSASKLPGARKGCSGSALELPRARKGCSSNASELPKVEKAAPAVLGSCQKVEKAAPAVLRSCPELETTLLHRVRRRSTLENANQRDFGVTSRSKLIRNHVRRNCSNTRGSAPLHSVFLCSVPPYSVHVYARVHTSIYIYIYMYIHIYIYCP